VEEATTKAGDPADGPLLGNRDYLLFLVCRGCTMAAFQTMSVAVGWHIYVRTGDVLNLAYIGLFMFLPFLLLFLPAGLLADRVDRRLIMAGAAVAHAVAIAMTGLWLSSGREEIWPVFAFLFLDGIAQAFLYPATQAMLPTLVSRKDFPRALAGMNTVTKTAHLGGPAVGGLLIALIDTGVYAVIAALYLLGSAVVYRIRADLRVRASEPFGTEVLLGGFRHILRTRTVLAAISLDLLAVLLGGVMGLLPVVASDILEVGPEALGLMRATPAVGALIVGLALARYGLPGHVGRIFFAALVAFGLSIVVVSVSTIFWVTILALAIYGGSDMISVFIRHTLVQLGTPDPLRGRVSAVNAVSINASNQIGDFRAGVMAAVVGVPAAIAIGGVATLAIAVAWARIFPELPKMARL